VGAELLLWVNWWVAACSSVFGFRIAPCRAERIGVCFLAAFRFASSDKSFRGPRGIPRVVFRDARIDLRLSRQSAAPPWRARLSRRFLLMRRGIFCLAA